MVITYWIIIYSFLQSDTLESDLYETRELKIQLAHGFGQAFDEVEFQPRGSVIIKNFKGPKFSVEQSEVSGKILEKMKVRLIWFIFSVPKS